ncbi:Clp protease N-terminal domain-containing protein [Streptomyces sp. NPDC046215]|uniref:Clp R domain-containing protein n=1 Tax=Streptomyces stramineus TaxID=173861 RepID=A0ABP3KKJ2_9ACTN
MFERFTLNARMAVVRSQQEAHGLGHAWIGSEHLLLGIIAEKEAPVTTLAGLGLTYEPCQAAVRAMVGGPDDEARRQGRHPFVPRGLDPRALLSFAPEPEPVTGLRRLLPFGRPKAPAAPPVATAPDHLPWAPYGEKALKDSDKVTLQQADNRITLVHLLLSLLTPGDTVIAEVLRRLGTDPATVRAAVLADLGQPA